MSSSSEEFIYNTEDLSKEVYCRTHDGTEVARYEDPDKCIDCYTLAPGGLLFCELFDAHDNTQCEIIALDAQTLQPRHRFGLSLLNYVCAIVVVGEELFVCDCGNDRLQVFSLAGEHRRSITGEWKRPVSLCFAKDRLYLIQNDPLARRNPLARRRIFVLSLQGDTLQVYTHPIEGQVLHSLRCFDGKLLAAVRWRNSTRVDEVVALCGV